MAGPSKTSFNVDAFVREVMQMVDSTAVNTLVNSTIVKFELFANSAPIVADSALETALQTLNMHAHFPAMLLIM